MNEMMKWMKNFSRNQKGLSLVELLCAVTILSIIIAGVGTSMVVSARSYQRSNTELDLQQKSQIAANLLTNLIIDADEIISPPADGSHSSELKINKLESGVLVEYQISWSGTSLVYSTGSESGTLAEDISDFSIWRVSDNNLDFTLEVSSNDGRTFKSDYHVTPRNGVSAGSGNATTGTTKSIWAENELTLEPNQVYEDLNVQIIGAPMDSYAIEGLSGNTDLNTKVEPKDANTIKITVGSDEYGDAGATFRFQIKALKSDGSVDSEVLPFTVNVHVRRVTNMGVGGSKTEGGRAKANSVYQVTAQTAGPNLPRVPGAWYDLDYVPTHPVTWELQGEGLPSPVNSFAVIESSSEDANLPFCKVRLLQDIPKGGAVKVIAVAKHPEGTVGADQTNKSGLPYGTVKGEYVIKNATDINRGESADRMPFKFNVGDLGNHDDIVKDLYYNKLQAGWSATTNPNYIRLKEEWDAKPSHEQIKNVVDDFFNTENPTTYAEYRFVMDEEKSDESKWSPWIPMLEYDGGTPIFRPSETVYFRPDKDYVLQARVSIVKTGDSSVVYWPLEDTPSDQYMTEYFVSKVSISDIWFEWDVWWPNYEKFSTKGTNTVPSIPKGQHFYVNIGEVLGYGEQNSADHMYAIVEREVSEGVWIDVTSSFEGLNGKAGKGGNAVAQFVNVRTYTPGRYRVLFYMKDISYKASIGAAEEKLNCDLYDRTTSEGMFYFNITD